MTIRGPSDGRTFEGNLLAFAGLSTRSYSWLLNPCVRDEIVDFQYAMFYPPLESFYTTDYWDMDRIAYLYDIEPLWGSYMSRERCAKHRIEFTVWNPDEFRATFRKCLAKVLRENRRAIRSALRKQAEEEARYNSPEAVRQRNLLRDKAQRARLRPSGMHPLLCEATLHAGATTRRISLHLAKVPEPLHGWSLWMREASLWTPLLIHAAHGSIMDAAKFAIREFRDKHPDAILQYREEELLSREDLAVA